MPRLHPGRRAGSGVPGPRRHRPAGGEGRAGPGTGGGGGGRRVSSDHASGWGRGQGRGRGGYPRRLRRLRSSPAARRCALALPSPPPPLSLSSPPSSLSLSPFSPPPFALSLSPVPVARSAGARRQREHAAAAARAERAARGEGGGSGGRAPGDSYGAGRPDAPWRPAVPAPRSPGKGEVGEAQGSPEPRAARVPASTALQPWPRLSFLPPSLPPGAPVRTPALPSPLALAQKGQHWGAPEMELGQRAAGVNAPPTLCHWSALPCLLFHFAHRPPLPY